MPWKKPETVQAIFGRIGGCFRLTVLGESFWDFNWFVALYGYIRDVFDLWLCIGSQSLFWVLNLISVKHLLCHDVSCIVGISQFHWFFLAKPKLQKTEWQPRYIFNLVCHGSHSTSMFEHNWATHVQISDILYNLEMHMWLRTSKCYELAFKRLNWLSPVINSISIWAEKNKEDVGIQRWVKRM